MRRLLAGLLIALLPSLALGQAATIANGACRLDGVDCGVTASGVATAGTIAVWGSGPALGSFDWLTATDATKTVALPKGTLNAGLVKATALSTPGSITVTPVLSKVASITTVAGSALVDGDYLTVEYAPGLTVPIEFDLSPGDGTTGGRVPYVFATGDSADDIRDGLITLLNGAAGASLTASSGGAATVSIVLDTPGAVGGTLTENVADGTFAVTGFADPTAATTVTYRLVAHLADGTATEAGAASSTAASTATLSAANFLRLTWSAVSNAAYYSLWRTVSPASPATTGKIVANTTALTYDDTGLAGDSGTAPTSNSTGRLVSTALTSGRIPLVGTGGQIQDDAGLTYSGTGTGLPGTGLTMTAAGVRVGDGDATHPSVSFASDPDTGLYSYYADYVGMAGRLALRSMSSGVFATVGTSGDMYFLLQTADPQVSLGALTRLIGWSDGGLSKTGAAAFALGNGTYGDTSASLSLSKVTATTLNLDYTNTATVGAVTINKAAGRAIVAAGQTAVVVTNSLCLAATEVFATVQADDATAYVKNVVPAAGSFTINLGAAATADTPVAFFLSGVTN